MKRALATVAGAVVGLVLTGVAAPALMLVLPPRLRGATALWAAAVAVAMVSAFLFWFSTSPGRPRER
jgi:hypothetical protein